MGIVAILLILTSAFLHISWNFLLKYIACDNKYMIYVYFLTSLLFSPFFFIYKEAIPYLIPLIPLLLLTAFGKGFANWTLIKSYKFGDYSFAYPLRNALPMCFTCFYSVLIGNGGKISLWAYFGFLFIFLGCLFMPLKSIKDFKLKNYITFAFVFVLISSISTATYSIIDSNITKSLISLTHISKIGIALFLIPVFYFTLAWFMFPFNIIDKYYFTSVAKIDINKPNYNFGHIFIHSLCMAVGYLLVLIAFTYAKDVSYIVAFRQVGLPISFVIGYFVLKEKIYFGKKWGLILIILGLILTMIK